MDIYGNKRHIFSIALKGVARWDYANAKQRQKLIKNGDTMYGSLNLSNNKIVSLNDPTYTQ